MIFHDRRQGRLFKAEEVSPAYRDYKATRAALETRWAAEKAEKERK